MPSVWEETAGLAAMEQMIRGKPTIVADIGGLSEIVGDGGLKFSPGDVHSLAACMARFLDDPSLIDRIGKRALERATRLFTTGEMVANHMRLYQKL